MAGPELGDWDMKRRVSTGSKLYVFTIITVPAAAVGTAVPASDDVTAGLFFKRADKAMDRDKKRITEGA